MFPWYEFENFNITAIFDMLTDATKLLHDLALTYLQYDPQMHISFHFSDNLLSIYFSDNYLSTHLSDNFLSIHHTNTFKKYVTFN